MRGLKIWQKGAAAAVVVGLLASCAPDFNPPPGYQGGFLWESNKSRTIAVEPGDTIYTISRRYDVPSRVIIARNGLAAPYNLTAGQQLILDPVRSHTVVKGDTLSQLAATYSIEMSLLASANDLSAPYIIRVGQELWIPDPFSIAAAPAQQLASAAAPVSSEPLPPVSAPVARAPRSAFVEESLAPPPGSAVPSGTVIVPNTPTAVEAPAATVPAVAGAIASAPLAALPGVATVPVPTPSMPSASAPVPSVTGPPAAVPLAEKQVAIAVPAPISEPPARASARFSWPLRGKVLASFGAAGQGLHNDGINLAAPAGTQVRAADNGVVAYAGSELKGFGNLLLIKHADGLTTAYAHNAKLLVKRGDEVKQGQVVAVVGRTGNVDSPQLHFEVRKGTQAMDPLAYLAQ